MNPTVSVGVPIFSHLILISFLFSLLLLFDLTYRQILERSRLFLLRQKLIIFNYGCDTNLFSAKDKVISFRAG